MSAVNLRTRSRGNLRRKIDRLKVGDDVKISYWRADAQIVAAGPVTEVDADGVWVDVLRVDRGARFSEVTKDGGMPIVNGRVLSPDQLRVGYHVAAIETYRQLTSQTCGYVTDIEDGGFWVGLNWIRFGDRDDNGEHRGVTIKLLSLSEDDVYEIRIHRLPAPYTDAWLWQAEVWYMSPGEWPQMILDERIESLDRERVEFKARRAIRRVHDHGRGDAVIRVTTAYGDPDLQPLFSRNRYTDEEWEYARAGRCAIVTASYPSVSRCGQPSSPTSYYRSCGRHDREIREDYPDTYGS